MEFREFWGCRLWRADLGGGDGLRSLPFLCELRPKHMMNEGESRLFFFNGLAWHLDDRCALDLKLVACILKVDR